MTKITYNFKGKIVNKIFWPSGWLSGLLLITILSLLAPLSAAAQDSQLAKSILNYQTFSTEFGQ